MPFSLRLLVPVVTLAMLGALPGRAHERDHDRADKGAGGGFSAADAESLREDLLHILDGYQRMGARRGIFDAVEAAAEARQMFVHMPAEEFEPFAHFAWAFASLRRSTEELESAWDESLLSARRPGDSDPLLVSSETGACCDTSTGICTDTASCEISVCSHDASIVCSDKVCSNDGSIVCEVDIDCDLNQATGEPYPCVEFDCGTGNTCDPTPCSSNVDCSTNNQGKCVPGTANSECQGAAVFHAGALCGEITCSKSNPPPDGAFPTPTGSDFGDCASVRADTALVLVGLIAVQVGELENIIAQRICGQMFAGFNGELACIAFDLVFLAQRSLFAHVVRCVSKVDMVEINFGYQRSGHIHTELEDAQTGPHTSLLVNKNLLIDARVRIIAFIDKMAGAIESALHNAAKKIQLLFETQQDAQNVEVRAFRAYTMQILIEEDLGTPFDQNREARFQLPRDYLCPDPLPPPSEPHVPCSGLEDVAEVVDNTIANMLAAGMPVFDAEAFRDKGDQEFSDGNYKAAYALYAIAYRLATGLEGSLPASGSQGGRGQSGSRLTGGGR